MVHMKIELQPFTVPNYVIGKMPARPRQDGIVEAPKWELMDVDAETLSDLCDDFRREVFKKAQRPDPHPRVLSERTA